LPLIIQEVLVIFIAVAIPNGAKVRDPVVPGPARIKVSDVIAIVTVAPVAAINVIAVPTGSAKLALELIVIVRVAVE
jgi:hypothetical protein